MAKSFTDRLPALFNAAQEEFNSASVFRDNYRKFVQEYVGWNYGRNGARSQVPVNFIRAEVDTMTANLAPWRLSTSVIPDDPGDAWEADTFRLELDQELDTIGFPATVRRCIVNAIFMVGIAKCGNYSLLAGYNESGSEILDAGQPFVGCVSPEDWIYDTKARSPSEWRLVGNLYQVPLDEAREFKEFRKEQREALQEGTESSLWDSWQRVEDIGAGDTSYQGMDDFAPKVTLLDVYVPAKNVMVTFSQDGVYRGKALREYEPEVPPYHTLSFKEVPGSTMPVSLVAGVYDLHMAIAEGYRKLIRQAKRMKTILQVNSQHTEDADRVTKTPDGAAVSVDGQKPEEVRYGGPDSNLLGFMMHLRQRASSEGGAIDTLGGLAPGSPTLGQEQLLAQNANIGLADMKLRVADFIERLVGSVGYYVATDPVRERTVFKEIAGIRIPRVVTPEVRKRYRGLDVKIEPYTTSSRTPEQRLAILDKVMRELLVPMSQALQQQGREIDIGAYLDLMARVLPLPELRQIVTLRPEGRAPAGGESHEGKPEAGGSERRYVRVNKSEKGGGEGEDGAMMRKLIGAGQMGGGE